MIYIYTPRSSAGARDLAEGIMLQGTIARRTKGGLLQGVTTADSVVCWGAHVALPNGVKSLNNTPAISKFTEAQKLAAAGVPTVQVSRTKPADVAAARQPFEEEFFPLQNRRLTAADATAMAQELTTFALRQQQRRQAYDRQPAPAAETWLPRRNNHVGGSDLLNPTPNEADFWSKKENIVEEYRLHMFKGKSIRAGKKVQVTEREGRRITPHQWIRSYDAGWIIQYNEFESNKGMREIAAKALEALGLDFGAVDIGKKADGSLIVFEVNRAPGVEGNTIGAYAKHIIAWSEGREIVRQ